MDSIKKIKGSEGRYEIKFMDDKGSDARSVRLMVKRSGNPFIKKEISKIVYTIWRGIKNPRMVSSGTGIS